MNTNALAKHYDKLTPRERLPLILAASARGDAVERERLLRSAPRIRYTVADHFGLAQAFHVLSTLQLMELLDTAALYFQALGYLDCDDKEFGEKMLDYALMHGYLLKVKLAGWRLFCAEHGLTPELNWAILPGYETVQTAEQMAQTVAFVPEGAAAYLKRSGRDDLSPPTAEGIAAVLRVAFKVRAESWG